MGRRVFIVFFIIIFLLFIPRLMTFNDHSQAQVRLMHDQSLAVPVLPTNSKMYGAEVKAFVEDLPDIPLNYEITYPDAIQDETLYTVSIHENGGKIERVDIHDG